MILARAPIPGHAKTRLIPALGPEGAAQLQERFIADTVSKAVAAQTGAVTLWCTPHTDFPIFQQCKEQWGVTLTVQSEGNLGVRMLAALSAYTGPTLTIGTDCPGMTPAHLRRCADALRSGADAVFLPVEDGGYALVGTKAPTARLFEDMTWSTASVMAKTRKRLTEIGWHWEEPAILWDVDEPCDLARYSASILAPC